MSPTSSLKASAAAAAAGDSADTAEADNDDLAATPHAASHLGPLQLLRRMSSSGAGDFSGPLTPLSAAAGGYALSPTVPTSPREEIEGQAAEVQRRWSLGIHRDMLPEPGRQLLVQQQPYRPPVFNRLSSGRGGCRITAAAAAASAREQHAARRRQQLQQLQDAGGGGSTDGVQQGSVGIRRYHSLDITRVGGQQQHHSSSIGAAASPCAAAAAATGGLSTPSAQQLLPLAATHARDLSNQDVPHMHGQQQYRQQYRQQQSPSAVAAADDITGYDVYQQLRGVVKHRSLDLDWGHKLAQQDSA